MTMPIERTRALRWGWEFLWELQSAANLTPEQVARVRQILRHYPSTNEIKAWANDLADLKGPVFTEITNAPWIAAENPDEQSSAPHPDVPISADRGPTTPQERLQALRAASDLFSIDLRGASNLSNDQRQDLAYVARHFPAPSELDRITRMEERAQRVNPGRKVWLELNGLATETFAKEDEAFGWLHRAHPMLEGEAPLAAAKTSFQAQRVKDILLAIKYGGVV